ncbi:triphosphoribosyl-dephospho-CoA synthase [Methylobacterium haplocladii]|uniref:Triphosphoribosyl-dephospho-CoA synthase n=1 Tax=Methylobacterium haplocladii TaxID=1176176 RepID=A0A512IUU7_9HYPH|nr:triphosphoribosyl-dephospho-CoA synthase [Methylobacterium haplocladii]GEP01471.1 triphosphoribosyl-dephospho-CoA synthase [Methylobacterium haplocladii]GJD85014.1 2-(5''-triphosphoribosyl)-3'-dephosphocoenzyme-A synthase [Methylobacterium haplocladii]GLS58889.1 triphosphoribosyl-dephospho-CoA synthase [Methylobacterium haplocladii]
MATQPDALSAEVIADLYRDACLAELDALKVGNVHAYAAGHRMEVADFVTSAEVSAPHLAKHGASVGERVRGGVEATIAAVGQNTNLGILLLCAPLARAAEAPNGLRRSLSQVLDALDESDGTDVFEAIRRANPGGLGKAERHDVTADAPPVTLRAAMAEAASRDRIARAYVTGFADLFEVGLTALMAARAQGLDAPWTATAVHLAFLREIPDSHIARKHGLETAEAIRQETAATLGTLDLRTQPVEALLAYDRSLKAAGINPGTSADFTVATLFADALITARGEWLG